MRSSGRLVEVDADSATSADARVELIDRLVSPDDLFSEVRQMAKHIAARPWRTLELTKLSLPLHRPASTDFDITSQVLLFNSDENSVRMNLARRTPSTKPLEEPT